MTTRYDATSDEDRVFHTAALIAPIVGKAIPHEIKAILGFIVAGESQKATELARLLARKYADVK
jgi:hypothetical protein